MKKLGYFLVLVGIFYACSSESGTDQSSETNSAPTESTTVVEEKKAPDGAKLYKRHCVVCHGAYGDMGVSGAKDLSLSELTLEERVTMVAKGKNAMIGFESLLDEDEIKAVAEYTFNLKSEK